MPLDGITLGAVVHELDQTLKNAKVDKVHQPEKDELTLTLRVNNSLRLLLISANASNPRIYLTTNPKPNPQTPPRFCMLLRKHLTGGRVTGMEQLGNERIVKINFLCANELGDIAPKSLIVEIMGKHSNIILVDDKNIIIDAIKHVTSEISRVRQVLPHYDYMLPQNQGKLDPFLNKAEVTELLSNINDLPTPNFLFSNIVGVSKQAAEEIVFRMKSHNCVLKGYEDYIKRVLNKEYSPTLLVDESQNPIDFLPFNYQVYTQDRQRRADSMSGLLEEYYMQRDMTLRIQSRTREMHTLLNNLIERCLNKRAAHQQILNECADMDKYRIMGELLTANIYKVERGAGQVLVSNYYSPEQETMAIPLDPKFSPAANAQRYFKKYAKLKNASKLIVKQIEENEAELAYLESLLNNLSLCTTYEDLNEIKEEMIREGYIAHKKKAQQNKASAPSAPLKFTSKDGIEILVGKNNKQNDILTLKTAAPTEMWLHVKNMAGSHVIIRKSEGIPDSTLLFAAQLAAYFSKGRNSGLVPVDYTLCKNVKKPKGAKPGMVIYDHYKTINVTPDEELIKSMRNGQQ